VDGPGAAQQLVGCARERGVDAVHQVVDGLAERLSREHRPALTLGPAPAALPATATGRPRTVL
jgi:hypothetical protein